MSSNAGRNAWIVTACSGSRLIAYAICDRHDRPAYGLKRVRLVDYQWLDGSEEAFRSVLSFILRKCRSEGVHVFENPGCWLARKSLPESVAPYGRSLASWTHYYKANDKALGAALQDPSAWAPSYYDGDASL
jgi:hypothetical protein